MLKCGSEHSLVRLTSSARSLVEALRGMLEVDSDPAGFQSEDWVRFCVWVCGTLAGNAHSAASWLNGRLADKETRQNDSSLLASVAGACGKLCEQIKTVEPFLPEIFDAIPASERFRNGLEVTMEDLLEDWATACHNERRMMAAEQEKTVRRLARHMECLKKALREFAFFQRPDARAVYDLVMLQLRLCRQRKPALDAFARLLRKAEIPEVLWRDLLETLTHPHSIEERDRVVARIYYRVERHLIYGNAYVLNPDDDR